MIKPYNILKLSLLFSCIAFAQNPLIKGIGMSDPHVRVFNDTIYLYSGHDFSPNDTTWVMKNWRVFSTTDLVNWTLEETISPKYNYMDDNSTDCWASDAATRNGKYYFYFSDRKRGVGVMTSNSPKGKFTDALGKPLVSPMHDPTILVDDDSNNTPYIIYGDKAGGGFHVARLNDDMISLAEQPKPIIINGDEWNNAPHWMDKNYVFKKEGMYYLSWGRDYAISDNIYGPYNCVGAVGKGYNLNEFAHGSFFSWKGQFYHIWCYYIKQGFKFRESIITYCHFDDNGNMVTDTKFLDANFSNGVGQYNASWDRIEAEWYYEISGDVKKTGNKNDGFILSNIKDGDWVRFSNVTFNENLKKCVLNTKLIGEKATIELRLGKPDGTILGKFNLSHSESFNEIKSYITPIERTEDIYLVFRGAKENTLQIDWFKFE